MIGLFLGKTDFPKKILIQLKKRGIKYFIIDLTKKNIFKKDKYSYSINIGKFGQILDLINKNNYPFYIIVRLNYFNIYI